MYEVKESDWKILRKKVPDWQERYMEKLTKEYIELLQRDKRASENFWDLENRIFKDKRSIGVVIDMRRSRMVMNLVELCQDGVITVDELNDFSDELQFTIKRYLHY